MYVCMYVLYRYLVVDKMDRWMDGQTDGWMEGVWVGILFCSVFCHARLLLNLDFAQVMSDEWGGGGREKK